MSRFGNSQSAGNSTRPFLNGRRRGQWAETVRKDVKTGVRSVETVIAERPLLSLSVGFAVGFLLGCLVKRI